MEQVERVLSEIEKDFSADYPEEWERFRLWVRSEALSQEVFGEYLMEGSPEALHVAWYAYLDACTINPRRDMARARRYAEQKS